MDYEEKLLKEYELCYEKTAKLEDIIWQTASIFSISSAVGIITLSSDKLITVNPKIAVVIGLLAIGILLMWWRFARRWWSIQHVMFFRMREIEEKIGFESNLLVDKTDKIKKGELMPPSVPENRRIKFKDLVNNHEYHGIQPMTKFFLWVSISAWIAFIFIRILDKPILDKPVAYIFSWLSDKSDTFSLLSSKLSIYWLVILIYFLVFISLYLIFSRKP